MKQTVPSPTPQWARWLIVLGTIAVMAWAFPRKGATRYSYELGRPWAYSQLLAPFDIPIRPDSASVARATDSLAHAFIPVYRVRDGVLDSLLTLLPTDSLAAPRLAQIQTLMRQAYARGVMPNRADRQAIPGTTDTLRLMRANVMSRTPSSALVSIDSLRVDVVRLLTRGVAEPDRRLITSVSQLLVPNIIYAPDVSQGIYQHDLLPFTSDRGIIQQGQSIIDKGHVITRADYDILRTYDQMMARREAVSAKTRTLRWVGQTLFILFIIVGMMRYFTMYASKVTVSTRSLGAVMSIMCLVYLFAVVVDSRFVGGVYLTPFALVPVVVAVFFDSRTALLTGMSLVLLVAGFVSSQLEFIFIETAGVCAVVYSIRTLTSRSQLIRAAIIALLCMWAAYAVYELMVNGSLANITLRRGGIILGSAVLTSFAYIVIYVYERVFGLISAVTLIELADINRPLLRQLSDDCPGTFQHSMGVSTLASDAAARLGANVQLVRTGALYHDVGKLANPAFFTENQSGVNPHDTLTPLQSAAIITSHVAEGLRRADRAGVPSAVSDFIAQHHGRGVARYFYINHCKAHPDENVDPGPFRYPGPNPQTLEASILMMADSVEAASRSLSSHTPEEIAALVDKIIDTQVAEGLHAESPVSFRDIRVIKDAFVKRLRTIYHARIVYPEADTIHNS